MTTARRYVEHLLAGGTTAWEEWPSAADVDRAGRAWEGELPGAAQAELLRRVNQAWRGPAGPPPDLARRVLERAAPGRGVVDLRLGEPRSTVPVGEVLRVGSGVLADLVAELAPAKEEVPPDPPHPLNLPRLAELAALTRRRTGPRFVLEGPPLTVAALRDRLAAVGAVEGGPPRLLRRARGRHPEVAVVVVLPLQQALFEVWSHRAQWGSSRHWPAVVGEWRSGLGLPAAAAYDRRAAFWAHRIGRENVHVVAGADLDAHVQAVLGRRPGERDPRRLPADLRPVAVDVLRHVNEVLVFRPPDPHRKARLDRFVELLRDVAFAGPPVVGVPAPHRAWAAATEAAIARRLRLEGYPAHGRLGRVKGGAVRRPRVGRGEPTSRRTTRPPGRWAESDVLAGMVEALVRVAEVSAAEHRSSPEVAR